ncbi:HAD family hydrolase [bacterium]|nr:HAD family hydrolase [bacterium]
MKFDLNRPKGILFDYWGTLVNWKPNRKSGINGLLKMIPDRKDITFEMVKEIADELMEAAGEIRKSSMIEFSRAQFDRNLFNRLGIAFDLTDDELDRMYIRNSFLSEREHGVINMLSAVKQKDIKTGVVSNATAGVKAHTELLNDLGILKYIDFVMISSDYGFRKPHPQLFKTALARMGTKPENTWFAGDTLTDDVIGSTNAGMTSVWYNPKEKPNDTDLFPLEIRSWDEFVKLLKELG